jgi:hypothetical protein
MRKIVAATAMGIGVLSLAAAVSADTLILRDGGRISGRVIGVAARIITFEDASGVAHRHPADEVAALEFSSGRGRNAAIGTMDGAGALAGRTGHADKTLGRSLEDSLRLYALLAQFKR